MLLLLQYSDTKYKIIGILLSIGDICIFHPPLHSTYDLHNILGVAHVRLNKYLDVDKYSSCIIFITSSMSIGSTSSLYLISEPNIFHCF